ncbi:MAG: beta-ketoacyl-ACP synthase 3 [Lachnospiraceae bacterium]|jgi:3-oxoacyl-[acyl-carrier-protein] synthase-3|nr:beta-ketoacyl-ACP synthase 3 [Lachnospiraceae bacterium]
MQGVEIVATGRAVPKKAVTNDDLAKIIETNDEWIVTRTGIKQRYYCNADALIDYYSGKEGVERRDFWEGTENNLTLGIEAATKAVLQAEQKIEGFDRNEIGVVIATATSAYQSFPAMACMIQTALSLPKSTMAFDMNSACSGFVLGMDIARGLLEGGKKKYALLVGTEQLSRITDFKDRSTCILFGDGAGAALLKLTGHDASDPDHIYAHRAWSDGQEEVLHAQGVGCDIDSMLMYMDGQPVFKFAVGAMSQGIKSVLKDATELTGKDFTMDDVQHVVPHQANARIIQNTMKRFGENGDKFYMNIGEFGNTSTASIPIALDELNEKGMLKSGDKVVIVGFGGGLTWASALFTIG